MITKPEEIDALLEAVMVGNLGFAQVLKRLDEVDWDKVDDSAQQAVQHVIRLRCKRSSVLEPLERDQVVLDLKLRVMAGEEAEAALRSWGMETEYLRAAVRTLSVQRSARSTESGVG